MKYVCTLCNWVYDEDVEDKKFSELSDDYQCPVCMASKDFFEEQK
ncbi:rubredoxin [bacterium]|nr:rubredoxin [bacterium]